MGKPSTKDDLEHHINEDVIRLDAEWEWKYGWGDDKPWHCPVCNLLLSSRDIEICDGTDALAENSIGKRHAPVKKQEPVTFQEYLAIKINWLKEQKK